MTIKQRFDGLEGQLTGLGEEIDRVSESEIVVQARHVAVGDIVILLEGNEITVRIGDLFHKHFEGGGCSKPELESVVGFVSDFIRERYVLTVNYSNSNSKPSTARLDNLKTGETSIVALAQGKRGFWAELLPSWIAPRREAQSFKWSGPIPASEVPVVTEGDSTLELAEELAALTPDEMTEVTRQLQARSSSPQQDNSTD